jgi:hypothetical protein
LNQGGQEDWKRGDEKEEGGRKKGRQKSGFVIKKFELFAGRISGG